MPVEMDGASKHDKCYNAPMMEFSDDNWADLHNL
jgi:hypothetical protein